MTAPETLYFSVLLVACIAIAFTVLWLFAQFRRDTVEPKLGNDDLTFLFDGRDLVQSTPASERVLSSLARRDDDDWAVLLRTTRRRFPDLPEDPDQALALAPAELPAASQDDAAVLKLSRRKKALQLTLHEPKAPETADMHIAQMMQDRVGLIEHAAEIFPYPIWLRSTDGVLVWENRAFKELCATYARSNGSLCHADFELELRPGEGTRTERITLDMGIDGLRWYDVTVSRSDADMCLHYAIDVDAVVAAERGQRKFVQTLTKTFAHLSTGLAIFDRRRQLQLFNPALIDLLDLPADFLSAQPTLFTFFDKLRENRMMPELKDYTSWRQEIATLVIAARDGHYQETWTLPSGLTYRVTGRPHPDGAIALLFEDISAEISLTRRFRAQLSLWQSVIDTLDEAVAVFTPTLKMATSNDAFRTLWKMDPEKSFAEISFADTERQWRKLSKPTSFWSDLHKFMTATRERTEWFSDITMQNGTQVECRVTPLAGGAVLIGFRLRPILGASRPGASSETGQEV